MSEESKGLYDKIEDVKLQAAMWHSRLESEQGTILRQVNRSEEKTEVHCSHSFLTVVPHHHYGL